MSEQPTTTDQYPLTYVRWQRDQPRRGRVFDQSRTDHPMVAMPCPLCLEPLGNEPWQLIAVGPLDEEDRGKHDEGRWYSAAATVGHAECVAGSSDAALDRLVAQLIPQSDGAA